MPRRPFLSTLAAAAILACVLITSLLVSAGGGALAGQRDRSRYMTQTVLADIDDQYAAAIADIEDGNYGLAAQRIQYVLQVDPDYPGAAEQLAEIARRRNLANTPAAPNPTVLPPSRAEDSEELFQEAKALFETQEWAASITRFSELRALDPDFRQGEVLQYLYDARVTLGVLYIRGERLQEGIVLLEDAQEIKPLDDFTAGELRLANLYLNGLTYWNLNWATVISNLRIIYDTAPQYRDVEDRLFTAYGTFGQELLANGAYCDAANQLIAAAEIDPTDEELEEALQEAEALCENPIPTPTFDGSSPASTPVPGTPDPTPSDGTDATPTSTLRPGEIP